MKMVVRASLEWICFRLVLKGDLEDPADAIFWHAFCSQMFINNPHGYARRYNSNLSKYYDSVRGTARSRGSVSTSGITEGGGHPGKVAPSTVYRKNLKRLDAVEWPTDGKHSMDGQSRMLP